MVPRSVKTLLALILALFSVATAFVDFDVPPTGVDPQIYAVKGLISRLLPQYQTLFELQLISRGASTNRMFACFSSVLLLRSLE